MPGRTKIVINVPEPLLMEINDLETEQCIDRSELILQALQYYLGERRRKLLIEQMKKGYMEMAPINLAISGELSPWEWEAMVLLEKMAE